MVEYSVMAIPKTSVTLLKALSVGGKEAQWAEFIALYEPMMRAYLTQRFPYVDADDIIQETLVALIRVLPNYHYDPNSCGNFHNYLTGIVRKKALKAVERQSRVDRLKAGYAAEPRVESAPDEAEEKAWRESAYGIVIGQFFSDETVSARTKQVFRRVAIRGESPEEVARDFGISRHSVDQIKSRSMEKLRALAAELLLASEETGVR